MWYICSQKFILVKKMYIMAVYNAHISVMEWEEHILLCYKKKKHYLLLAQYLVYFRSSENMTESADNTKNKPKKHSVILSWQRQNCVLYPHKLLWNGPKWHSWLVQINGALFQINAELFRLFDCSVCVSNGCVKQTLLKWVQTSHRQQL